MHIGRMSRQFWENVHHPELLAGFRDVLQRHTTLKRTKAWKDRVKDGWNPHKMTHEYSSHIC